LRVFEDGVDKENDEDRKDDKDEVDNEAGTEDTAMWWVRRKVCTTRRRM
jgi:hypothetical protein